MAKNPVLFLFRYPTTTDNKTSKMSADEDNDEREWMHPLPETLEVDGAMWNDLRWDGIDLMITNTKNHNVEGAEPDYKAMYKSLQEETIANLIEFKGKLLDIESSIQSKENEKKTKKTSIKK